jgi:hypothetical protein
VFENRMLRRIFGPKREDVIGDSIKCTMQIIKVKIKVR